MPIRLHLKMDSIVREGVFGTKIMILDDEPDIQTYLMVVLQDNGYIKGVND